MTTPFSAVLGSVVVRFGPMAMLKDTPGWRVETLGKGSAQGRGWMMRVHTERGNPTGRQLCWHPGGGHHGPDPYWRVKGYGGDLFGVIQ